MNLNDEKNSQIKKKKHNANIILWGPYCALVGVTFLILLKSYAYYQSGSTAMLGTLVDSVVDLAVSLMLFFAVKISLKPADEDHRDGHGKAEAIATLLQGAFMTGAAIFLAFEATRKFLNPVPVQNHDLAIIVALCAVIVSVVIITVQKYSLERVKSLAVEADYHHYKTDIFLNLSVIVALAVGLYGGPFWVDPLLAILIAGYFLFTAFSIIEDSVDMLMDRELPEHVRENIMDIVGSHENVHGVHDLRTRQSGMKMHISFDVELDPHISLQAAHDIVRALDHSILAQYPQAEVLIHMDPVGDTHDPRH